MRIRIGAIPFSGARRALLLAGLGMSGSLVLITVLLWLNFAGALPTLPARLDDFRLVRPGLSREQVEALIGPPLASQSCPGTRNPVRCPAGASLRLTYCAESGDAADVFLTQHGEVVSWRTAHVACFTPRNIWSDSW